MIVLVHPQFATKSYRQKLLSLWYKQELEKRIALLVHQWESVLAVRVSSYATRQMKTRWGTCNTRSKKILLNLELMKKSPDCLEYVVVHEMVHLLEASHNARFHALMTKYLPDWKATKHKLNGFTAEKDC
ncbi:MAG: M48 family metallopeptidase [Patescibacteria group bacterium]